jgi:hypothetical protein
VAANVREEVRPIKSEITIYDFRNFDLCKVRKFMVQNAPKLNILSKIALYHSHQKSIYILILTNNSFNNLRALKSFKNPVILPIPCCRLVKNTNIVVVAPSFVATDSWFILLLTYQFIFREILRATC